MVSQLVQFLTIFALLVFILDLFFRTPPYRGPHSDHFNGKQFFNIVDRADSLRMDKPLKGWLLLKKMFISPRWHRVAIGELPPVPVRVEGSDIRVTWVGHATVLIQTQGINIITDPMFSEYASPIPLLGPRRYVPPGVRLSELPPIDCILLSHNHYDHMDISALRYITLRDTPKLCTSLGNARFLEKKGIFNAIDMDWGQTEKLAPDIDIDCVPAQHFSARAVSDRNTSLWCGFVLRTPHGDIYFAGDTGLGPAIGRIKKMYPDGFRLALLPIGAYEPFELFHSMHLSPYDAVQVYRELGVRRAFGIHHGTFKLAFEGQDDAANELQRITREAEYSDVHFTTLSVGESTVVTNA